MTATAQRPRRRFFAPVLVIRTGLGANASLWLGIALIVAVGLLWVFAELAPLHDPYRSIGGRLDAPGGGHPLGTDDIGRDLFTRVALSGGSGILNSIATALAACAIGTLAGVTAGYVGGIVDTIIMRIVDAMLSIPGILLVLILRVILGTGTWQLILAMSILYAPTVARVMRSSVLVTKSSDFVSAAIVSGVRTPTIILRYLIPNSWSVLLVQASMIASSVVLLEATLSYLGQGVQPPLPAAGRMLFEYQSFIQTAPMLLIAPAVIVFALAAGFNLISDGLQKKFSIDHRALRGEAS